MAGEIISILSLKEQAFEPFICSQLKYGIKYNQLPNQIIKMTQLLIVMWALLAADCNPPRFIACFSPLECW